MIVRASSLHACLPIGHAGGVDASTACNGVTDLLHQTLAALATHEELGLLVTRVPALREPGP